MKHGLRNEEQFNDRVTAQTSLRILRAMTKIAIIMVGVFALLAQTTPPVYAQDAQAEGEASTPAPQPSADSPPDSASPAAGETQSEPVVSPDAPGSDDGASVASSNPDGGSDGSAVDAVADPSVDQSGETSPTDGFNAAGEPASGEPVNTTTAENSEGLATPEPDSGLGSPPGDAASGEPPVAEPAAALVTEASNESAGQPTAGLATPNQVEPDQAESEQSEPDQPNPDESGPDQSDTDDAERSTEGSTVPTQDGEALSLNDNPDTTDESPGDTAATQDTALESAIESDDVDESDGVDALTESELDEPPAALTVALSADLEEYEVGDTVTVTVAVTNDGLGDAEETFVALSLPVGLTVESGSDGCQQADVGTVGCLLGTVAAAAQQLASVTLTVNNDAIGALLITANVTSAATDESVGENTPSIVLEPSTTPSVSYIVTFAAGVDIADRTQALSGAAARVTASLPQLNMEIVDLPGMTHAARAAALANNPNVLMVTEDVVREAAAAPNDADYGQQWALPQISWDGAYGSISPSGSAVIAILDTGIDATHPDLGGNVISGTSILDGSNGLVDPNGHGTNLAGIAAASSGNGSGMAGVGYAGVSLMPVSVLAADGTGADSDIIAGVLYAADNGADVILMAFSNPSYSPALQFAVDYAWNAGVVIVAATGNDGAATTTYPAGFGGVVGVSSTNQNDQLTPGSNFGDAVYIAAPGAGIYTTTSGGSYTSISGTSAAAAHVAGAAALIAANDAGASNGQIVHRLAANADPAGTAFETGNGRLNLHRALLDTSPDSAYPAAGGPFVGPFEGSYIAAALTIVNDTGGYDQIDQGNGAQQDISGVFFDGATFGFAWDEPQLSGNNTSDICTYFEEPDNSVTSICYSVAFDGAGGFTTIFVVLDCGSTYGNGKCTGNNPVSTEYSVSCTDPSLVNPYFPQDPDQDLEAQCTLVGLNGNDPLLLEYVNTCTKPSASPSSLSNDCVFGPGDPDPGRLQLVKIVDGGAAAPVDFVLEAANTTDTVISEAGGNEDPLPLPVGEYVLSESSTLIDSGNYALESIVCVTDGGTPEDVTVSATVTLTELATTICTFTNVQALGSIEVVKDFGGAAGLVDLLVDGVVELADAGDGGTTGPVSVTAGDHAVSEEAGSGTDLADYSSSYLCVEDSNAASPISGSGTSLSSLSVDSGDAWVCTFTNTLLNAALDVTKTNDSTTTFVDADGSGDLSVGDTVSYTYTVENTGDATLTGVSVVDDLLGPVTLSDGGLDGVTTLAPAAIESGILTYVIESGDLGTTITNVVVADSDQTDPVDDTNDVAVPSPTLTVSKVFTNNDDADNSGYVSLGDTLTYTITATNEGTAALTNVVVSDDVTGDFTGDGTNATCDSPLAPDATCVLTVTYVVQPDDATAGEIVNTGAADSDQTPQDDDTVETPVEQNPEVTLVKDFAGDDPEQVVAGSAGSSFTLIVTNTGDVPLIDVLVEDIVDSRLTVIGLSSTDGADADTDADPQTVEWLVGSLGVDESATILVMFTVDVSVPSGQLVNVATVTAEGPQGDPQDPQDDITDQGKDDIEILSDVVLSIVKTFTADSVAQGSGGTFTLEVTNDGPVPATAANVTDTVNSSLVVTGVSTTAGDCSASVGQEIDCTVDLAGGDSVTITVDYTASPYLATTPSFGADGGSELRFVFVNGYVLEGAAEGTVTLYDDTGAVVATYTGGAKSDFFFDPPLVDGIDNAGFNLHLSCSDSFEDGFGATGGPTQGVDDQWEMAFASINRYKQGDFFRSCGTTASAFGVDNTATVTWTDSAGEHEDTDDATVTIPPGEPVPESQLTISKPAPENADEDGSGDVSEGDTLTYTVTATNTGAVNLTNVEVIDEMITPRSIVCRGVTRPGETCVLVGTYVVTAEDVEAESIVNIASAMSQQTDEVTDDEITVVVPPQVPTPRTFTPPAEPDPIPEPDNEPDEVLGIVESPPLALTGIEAAQTLQVALALIAGGLLLMGTARRMRRED